MPMESRDVQLVRGMLAGILLARFTALALTPETPQNRLLIALLEMAPEAKPEPSPE